MAHAIALSTVAGVISDVIFFNAGAPGRTDDPVLAAGIERVLVELSSSALRLSSTTRGASYEGPRGDALQRCRNAD